MINDIENLRKKILFRSWHRGTKEMDLILGEFANNNVSNMDLDDLNKFQEFLNLSDPDLYKWIVAEDDSFPKEYLKKYHRAVISVLLK
jgi:antitoxin CptB